MIRTPEWFARCVAFPLYERARGRATLREMRRCAAELRLRPDALANLARERLRQLLTFAARELPYYRALFAASDVRPEHDDPYTALQRLPVLDKATVRAHARDMTWAAVPGGLQPAVTGGTSGDTLHFFLDRRHSARNMGARLALQQGLGVRPGDRRLFLWGSPIEVRRSRWRLVRDVLLNERVLDVFDLPPGRLDAYLDFLRRYRPRLIFGYGSALALLARRALRRGLTLLSPPRAVILTSDATTADERAAVRAAFGAPALNEYGSRELGIIAHECQQGRLHVLTPLVHVEILQDGRPVPPGEQGQIICTNLAGRAQPLIRYAPGDIGRFVPEPCACGSALPVLRLESARVNTFGVLVGGQLCSDHALMGPPRVEPSIVEFKVFQRAVDRLELSVVVDDQYTVDVAERLKRKYRAFFGPRVQVDVRVVDRIPPDPSGKRRCFVCNVQTAEAHGHPRLAPGELTSAH